MRLLIGLSALCIVSCSDAEPKLVTDEMIEGDGIPMSLTDTPGDVDRGAQVFAGRERGHCVLCHVVSSLDAEFQGNVGPSLDGIADRFSPAQLRLRIADYQIIRPGTLMPSYYRKHALYQVGADYSEEPVLTAQELEDLVAYLGTLHANDD